MRKQYIQLGTTRTDAGVIGCWKTPDHRINNKPATHIQCTACGHEVEDTGINDEVVKGCIQRMTRECACKAPAHSCAPPPDEITCTHVDEMLTELGLDHMKQAQGRYRISLDRQQLFVLLTVFNTDQNCWRLMQRGRPISTKWGDIRSLHAFLVQCSRDVGGAL